MRMGWHGNTRASIIRMVFGFIVVYICLNIVEPCEYGTVMVFIQARMHTRLLLSMAGL